MQNLLIVFNPNPNPPPQKILPIISSKITLKSSENSHSSKTPHLSRKNATHFTLNQLKPPKLSKKTQCLSSSLSQSKSILHLTLTYPLREILLIKQACFFLKNLGSIRTLKLYLYVSNPKNMKKALNIFAHSFQKAHYLNSLVLDFGFNTRLSPLIIRKLSSIFQTMQNLTRLSIFYFTQNEKTGNLLSPLLTGIQKLRSLSRLCLKFYQAFMDENQIELLCSGLSKCRSLIYLELDFQLCPNLTNEGIKKLFLLGKSLKLTHFELNLYVSANLVNEARVYKDLDNIMEKSNEDFSVISRYSGVSQNTTLRFSLKDQKADDKLQKFQVRFHQTHDPKLRKENKAQREVILTLPNLQHLKSLNLTCIGYYGSDTFSSNLTDCLAQTKSLEKLALELEMSPALSSLSGIIKSLTGLKIIPSLKALQLKFRDFTLIDAQIKSLLGSCLSKIRTLKALELDLGDCKISQTIFENLELLNSNGSLRQFESLRLVLNPTIEKVEKDRKFISLVKGVLFSKKKLEVEKFYISLRNLGDLKSLHLKLKDVAFSPEEQKALSKSLMEMKSLKKLEIESSYEENLEGNMRGFENLFIESQVLDCWLTLSVQFHKNKDERIAVVPVTFNFEDSGHVPYSLKISFCHYDDSPWYRHYPGFFKKLLGFFEEISPNFVEGNKESHRKLAQIMRDSSKIAFLDIIGPISQPPEVFKAFAQTFSIEDLKLAKYSFIISSR